MQFSSNPAVGATLPILLDPELSRLAREALLGAANVFDFTDHPAAIFLSNQRLIFVNASFEVQFGLRTSDLIGKIELPVASAALEGSPTTTLMLPSPIQDDGSPTQGGVPVKITLRIRPLRTSRGELVGHLCLLQDDASVALPSALTAQSSRESSSVDFRRLNAAFGGQASAPNGPLGVVRCGLSTREREVLECYGRGLHTKEIAAFLGISPPSVFTYRARLVRKLGITNLADFYLLAAQSLLVGPVSKGGGGGQAA